MLVLAEVKYTVATVAANRRIILLLINALLKSDTVFLFWGVKSDLNTAQLLQKNTKKCIPSGKPLQGFVIIDRRPTSANDDRICGGSVEKPLKEVLKMR